MVYKRSMFPEWRTTPPITCQSTLHSNYLWSHLSVYLCQQLQSFLPGNALQFHTIWSFPVQNVVDELIHGRPTGYFLRFSLLLREFPCLEESDDMLRPCRSLRLDGKD